MQATRSREDGVVLVEFALVLPLLLLLVVGFMQLGLAMNAKIDSTHLTAEGARYIVVNQNPGPPGVSMPDYIRSRAGTDALSGANVTICLPANPERPGSYGQVGDPVRVRMVQNYGLAESRGLAQLMGPALPGDIAVDSQTTMRLEAVPTKFLPLGQCP